jgi:hypothetical protein
MMVGCRDDRDGNVSSGDDNDGSDYGDGVVVMVWW